MNSPALDSESDGSPIGRFVAATPLSSRAVCSPAPPKAAQLARRLAINRHFTH